MCFKRLGISGIESISPDSENSVIPENFMRPLLDKYQKIIVLFDNDEPGLKSADKYKKKYGFNYVNLDMSKDLSDSVRDHGIEAVRDKLFPLLKQAL
jgi:5S rRNA maturation endonuclease (ribonuclease M5)